MPDTTAKAEFVTEYLRLILDELLLNQEQILQEWIPSKILLPRRNNKNAAIAKSPFCSSRIL